MPPISLECIDFAQMFTLYYVKILILTKGTLDHVLVLGP